MTFTLAEIDAAGWVLIIGAISANIVAIITALTALKTGRKVEVVHQLVNGAQTRIMDRNVQLAHELVNNGVAIPAPPPVDPPAGG